MRNPKAHAIAYRIWAYCHPKGWDCTVSDVADDLDLPMRTVKMICQHRGWNHRLRGVHRNLTDIPTFLINEIEAQGPVYI